MNIGRGVNNHRTKKPHHPNVKKQKNDDNVISFVEGKNGRVRREEWGNMGYRGRRKAA